MRTPALSFFLIILVTGCSSRTMRESAVKSEGLATRHDTVSSAGIVQRERYQEVHIHLDIGKNKLAAYQLLLSFDPRVAKVQSIRRCSHRTFPSLPEFDPRAFGRGQVRVFASRIIGVGPGYLHLLTVTFERVAPGATPINVEVEALYDDSEDPKRIQGDLEVWPATVLFP